MSMQLMSVLQLSVAVPALYALFRFRRLDGPTQSIAIMLLAALFTEVVGMVLAARFHNNVVVYNVYNVVRTIMMAIFFYRLTGLRQVLIAFYLLSGLALVEAVVHLHEFASLTAGLINLSVAAAGLYCYLQLSFNRLPEGYFALIGVLIFYHLSCFIYLAFLGYLGNQVLLFQIASIWAIVNGFCNMAFTFSLWMLLQSSLQPR